MKKLKVTFLNFGNAPKKYFLNNISCLVKLFSHFFEELKAKIKGHTLVVAACHDMLPQHLVCKNELNCEYCNITLARKNEAP